MQSNGDQAANNNDQNGNTDSSNQNGSGDLLDLADILALLGQQQQQVNNSNSNSKSISWISLVVEEKTHRRRKRIVTMVT